MENIGSNKQKIVALLGSFRKHYEQVKQIMDCFTANGFIVSSPKKANIINPGEDFVLFDTDPTQNPRLLEDSVLQKIEEADLVYICNVGGYIGTSVSFELGNLVAMRQKVYFLEMCNDPVFKEFFDESTIISPIELCKRMKLENEGYKK
jgi:hypothetical protein